MDEEAVAYTSKCMRIALVVIILTAAAVLGTVAGLAW